VQIQQGGVSFADKAGVNGTPLCPLLAPLRDLQACRDCNTAGRGYMNSIVQVHPSVSGAASKAGECVPEGGDGRAGSGVRVVLRRRRDTRYTCARQDTAWSLCGLCVFRRLLHGVVCPWRHDMPEQERLKGRTGVAPAQH
jgi:hypothetical protein